MIQTGYNSLPKTQRNFLWCIGRDGERELLKDRSQMVVFSLITAFGTLLRHSMEQRGPTITSCRGFLIYHPCTRSAHAFSTASPWNSQERSCHSHPVPGMLCTLWSPTTHPAPACAHLRALQLLWKMWAGCERIRSQWVGERHCPRLPPETPHGVTVTAQQRFSRSGQPLEAACSAHTVTRAGGEAPHSLQGELFKSIK